MTCQRCGTRKEMKMSSRRPCPWRTMNGYCLDPGKIRPLTVEDAITIPEVKALAMRYIPLARDVYSEFSNTRSPRPVNGMFPNDAEIVAPFLAAMKDKR